jgi:hypothetical protein
MAAPCIRGVPVAADAEEQAAQQRYGSKQLVKHGDVQRSNVPLL